MFQNLMYPSAAVDCAERTQSSVRNCLPKHSGRSVRRDDAYRVPEIVFFAVSAQQHRVKRNPWSETAHTAHTAMLTKYPETAHTVLSTPKQHKQHRSLRGQEDWPQDLRFDPNFNGLKKLFLQ